MVGNTPLPRGSGRRRHSQFRPPGVIGRDSKTPSRVKLKQKVSEATSNTQPPSFPSSTGGSLSDSLDRGSQDTVTGGGVGGSGGSVDHLRLSLTPFKGVPVWTFIVSRQDECRAPVCTDMCRRSLQPLILFPCLPYNQSQSRRQLDRV